MPKVFLGIDPGASGGVGVIRPDGIRVWAFGDKTERDIWDELRASAEGFEGQVFAVIERVHSMPKQGVSSSFKFGRSYGFLRGCLIGSGLSFTEVNPEIWQRELECRSGGDKNLTKARAQQLFPDLKLTHATSDALLLAEYGRRVAGHRKPAAVKKAVSRPPTPASPTPAPPTPTPPPATAEAKATASRSATRRPPTRRPAKSLLGDIFFG